MNRKQIVFLTPWVFLCEMSHKILIMKFNKSNFTTMIIFVQCCGQKFLNPLYKDTFVFQSGFRRKDSILWQSMQTC